MREGNRNALHEKRFGLTHHASRFRRSPMPTLKLRLDPGGPTRLEVTWGLGPGDPYKDLTLKQDGEELARFGGLQDLKQGQTVPLPASVGGGELQVGLKGKRLEILRYGEPLPGTFGSPESQHANAYATV